MSATNIIRFGATSLAADCSGITWDYCKTMVGGAVSTSGCTMVELGSGDYVLTNPNATVATAQRGHVTADATQYGYCLLDPVLPSVNATQFAGQTITAAAGTYYFVLTAFDTALGESGYSNEASKMFDTVAPASPKNLVITITVTVP